MSLGKAGASAELKYAELKRAWRKRNRRVFVCLNLICAAVVALALLAQRAWPTHSFTWGIFVGGGVSFVVLARELAPGWIENWQLGAYGEQATAKELRKLEGEGWVVLHDLPDGKRNVDHVLVGPGGVFVLDSKRVDGRVAVEASNVTVTRIDDPDLSYEHTGARHVVGLARETHDGIKAVSRIHTWVTPALVWWSDFPQQLVEGSCVHVDGNHLVAWLRNCPQRIAPSRIEQVARAVEAAWPRDDRRAAPAARSLPADQGPRH